MVANAGLRQGGRRPLQSPSMDGPQPEAAAAQSEQPPGRSAARAGGRPGEGPAPPKRALGAAAAAAQPATRQTFKVEGVIPAVKGGLSD